MRSTLFSLGMLLLSSAAVAGGKPSELSSAVKAELPYGSGALRRLMITAYDADLWTDAQPWSYDAPFALTLTYRMGFTTDELVDRSIEEMERASPLADAQKAAFQTALNKAFPNVRDGDRITALYTPNQGIAFFHNGRVTHTLRSPAMAKRFLDIWLAPTTSEPSLRRGLLKQ